MEILTLGREVVVSIKTLYENFGEHSRDWNIVVDEEGDGYYDLWNEHGCVCMDGETCVIERVEEDYLVLRNLEQEPGEHNPYTFKLEREHAAVCLWLTSLPTDMERLKEDGITLEQISEELSYREGAPDTTWDDNLFEYTTSELEYVEQHWND